MGDWTTFVLLLLFQVTVAQGLQHTVGDSIWSIPPSNDFYTNWSSSQSFHVGDTLYFDFDSALYDVIQVTRGEFDSCGGNHPLKALMHGPAVVPLYRKGVFYFICNVSNYCSLGQKLDVVVALPEEVGRPIPPSPENPPPASTD